MFSNLFLLVFQTLSYLKPLHRMPLLFSISSVKPKFSLNFKWPNYNCLGIHSCQKFFSAAVPLLKNPAPRPNFPCPLGFCWKPAVAKNCRLIEFSSSSAILYATKYFITAFWARKRETQRKRKGVDSPTWPPPQNARFCKLPGKWKTKVESRKAETLSDLFTQRTFCSFVL